MKNKEINMNLNLKTIRYLSEHLSGIIPERFSCRYIYSEAFLLLNKEIDTSISLFRVKLLDNIVLHNKRFFVKLKNDIEEIMNIYLLLLKREKNKSKVLEILWDEIGLDSKERYRFLLYMRGTPFIICRDGIKENIVLIRQFVDSLSDREKVIVGLYYYEGLTLKEISKALTVNYKDLVVEFSFIAFKFLFDISIKNLH